MPAKQISKQNKKEKKEKGKQKVVSRIWTRYLRVGSTSHGHYVIEDNHMIWWKVSNLILFPQGPEEFHVNKWITYLKSDLEKCLHLSLSTIN